MSGRAFAFHLMNWGQRIYLILSQPWNTMLNMLHIQYILSWSYQVKIHQTTVQRVGNILRHPPIYLNKLWNTRNTVKHSQPDKNLTNRSKGIGIEIGPPIYLNKLWNTALVVISCTNEDLAERFSELIAHCWNFLFWQLKFFLPSDEKSVAGFVCLLIGIWLDYGRIT